MNLSDCLPHLVYEFKNEAELVRAIEELSSKFTKERQNISDYLSDPRLVAAYTAFYLTTNFPKLSEVFKWLPGEWLLRLKDLPFIDLGAGPGTFSLAWQELAGGAQIHQIEHSKIMREQARQLWEGLHPDRPLAQHAGKFALPGSFVLFGHSANEMGADEAIKFIQEIRPDHILFIEPGTKTFFREMLKIRTWLLGQEYNVIYPCPGSMECPMANSENDWCHQFIHVQHSQEVERLSQLARRDRRLLPLTVQAFSKTFKHQDKERIVRVHPSTKFSYEWDVCTGELERYQVMKRGLEKKTLKRLDEVLAGSSIVSETDKVLEDRKRVKLIKINNKEVDP